MSDEEGEQQELSEAVEAANQRSRHQQILDLYNADALHHIAVGTWGKIIVEYVIVAVPLGFVLVPIGFLLAFLNFGPVTYGGVLALWIGFSTSLFYTTWCFTESAIFTENETERSDASEN